MSKGVTQFKMSNCASTTKQRRTVQKVPRVSNEFLERASDGNAAGPLHAAADNLILHPLGPEAYLKKNANGIKYEYNKSNGIVPVG